MEKYLEDAFKEISELAKKVRKLPDKEIDELWYSMSWVVEDHEPEFKSLRNLDIEHVRESQDSAEGKIWDLLTDGDEREETVKNGLLDFKANMEEITSRK